MARRVRVELAGRTGWNPPRRHVANDGTVEIDGDRWVVIANPATLSLMLRNLGVSPGTPGPEILTRLQTAGYWPTKGALATYTRLMKPGEGQKWAERIAADIAGAAYLLQDVRPGDLTGLARAELVEARDRIMAALADDVPAEEPPLTPEQALMAAFAAAFGALPDPPASDDAPASEPLRHNGNGHWATTGASTATGAQQGVK